MGGWGPGGLVACGLAAPGPQPAPARTFHDLFDEPPPWKALSFWQPWAALIARGVKADDTRDNYFDYRGPLAIHAAKTVDVAGAPTELCDQALGLNWRDSVVRGAFVAVCELVDCVPAHALYPSLTRANQAAGNFAPGRWALRLANVRVLRRPIPAIGRQWLFNWTPPEGLEDQLGPVLDHMALCNALGLGFARKIDA
jgi:hypothetical protein